MTEKLILVRVQYMPRSLEQGILYYSEEFEVAGHLCPCGCGNKVITPIGPTEWSFTETENGATLYPSIGNWELPCRTHYWIEDGQILLSGQWSHKQIAAGRRREEQNRKAHYKALQTGRQKKSDLQRFVDWIFRRN